MPDSSFPPLQIFRRRHFLGLLGRAILGSVALELLPWCPPAYAVVDPSTAALVVNTAINVVGLFSHGGSSIQDLLHLQAEMLAAISAELAAINNWMKQISEQLDKIELLIGQIPRQVVVEINESNIAGAIAGFAELQEAFTAIAKSREGITGAKQQTKEKLGNRLNDLQGSRLALMQPKYESIALVPTICAAAYAETQMMIMSGDNVELMLAATHTYSDWLKRISAGPTNASLASKIEALKGQHSTYGQNEVLTAQEYNCVFRAGSNSKSWWGTFKRVRTKPTISTDVAEIGDVNAEIEKLIKDGVLPSDQRPETVTLAFEDVQPEQPFGGQGGGPERAKWALMKRCYAEQVRLNAEAAQISSGLSDTGVQLISLHSLKQAADEGLMFLEKFSKKIRARA